ncbi:hypothetical protein [Nocardia sp. bgisy118]|uniref:hypothetical protein n=1 Tax=Nocardia sp. bgisy118 TaxID=3413786 RepID=UPI003F4A2E4A
MVEQLSRDPAVNRAGLAARSQVRRAFRESPGFGFAYTSLQRSFAYQQSLAGHFARFDQLVTVRLQRRIIPVLGSGAYGMHTLQSSIRAVGTPQLLRQMRSVLDTIYDRRLREVHWWVPDHIDPARPAEVRGLEEALPERRRRSANDFAQVLAQLRAMLRSRHRRASDPPGRLVTSRRQVPRGPNTHMLTQPCQHAGSAVRA